MTLLIAGGGIAGLTLGLTCHQLGLPFLIFEASKLMRPLGVGINLQPTAVRELLALGLVEQLAEIGVETRDYGMYSKLGNHIYTEPRGRHAGYNWPQYSVHRGQLHMLLYQTLIERAGPDVVQLGSRVENFENTTQCVKARVQTNGEETTDVAGDVLIGADGIHSAIRAQMYPNEGIPQWGGAVLWRGTSQAKPFLTGASMVMIGFSGLRFVSYPISKPEPKTGLATINWIANLNYDPNYVWRREDWSRRANLDDFLPQFEGLALDWIDIPGLIRGAEEVFEYPMVDSDPVPKWTFGNVSLVGDAAHPAYLVGSYGAGSAIIDARKIGRAFLEYGVINEALEAFEVEMRPQWSQVTLLNRKAGPDSILDVIEERCGGDFRDINDVYPEHEMAAFSAKYKIAAGFGVEQANAEPSIMPLNTA